MSGKVHDIVTPQTQLNVGDKVRVDGKLKEIARFCSDNGTMFTDGTWTCRSKFQVNALPKPPTSIGYLGSALASEDFAKAVHEAFRSYLKVDKGETVIVKTDELRNWLALLLAQEFCLGLEFGTVTGRADAGDESAGSTTVGEIHRLAEKRAEQKWPVFVPKVERQLQEMFAQQTLTTPDRPETTEQLQLQCEAVARMD